MEAADETFAVTDDDMPAVLPSATALTVNEGSTAAYTVRLATRPVGGAVTVAATSANASTATVAPPQLRFGRRRLGRAEDVPGAWRAGWFGDDFALGVRRGLRRRRDDDGGGDGAWHAGGGGCASSRRR